jgi:hypothetical protein
LGGREGAEEEVGADGVMGDLMAFLIEDIRCMILDLRFGASNIH